MFPSSAKTVHMTLFEHYKHCPRSPCVKKAGDGYCQFEKCKILVIDEGMILSHSIDDLKFLSRFHVVFVFIVQIVVMCSSLFHCHGTHCDYW